MALGPEREKVGQTAKGAPKSVFQETCASCHGERGQGNRELMAPPIANLSGWYVQEQVGKFRNGFRGAEPRDVHGQQMRAAVIALSDEEVEKALVELEAFPFVAPEVVMAGDARRGAELYLEQCMECHRYNGHGELAFKSAPLTGLPEWYLTAQMTKYREGIRGYDPEDERGNRMRDMTLRPADATEIADIIAYVETLNTEYPVEKGSVKSGNR